MREAGPGQRVGVLLGQPRVLGKVPLPSKVLSGLGSQEKAAPSGRCHWSLSSALAPLQICEGE